MNANGREFTGNGAGGLSHFIRVYSRFATADEIQKKKVAFPRRTWQINPVTHVKQ